MLTDDSAVCRDSAKKTLEPRECDAMRWAHVPESREKAAKRLFESRRVLKRFFPLPFLRGKSALVGAAGLPYQFKSHEGIGRKAPCGTHPAAHVGRKRSGTDARTLGGPLSLVCAWGGRGP